LYKYDLELIHNIKFFDIIQNMFFKIKLKIIRIKFFLKSFFQKKDSSQIVHNKDWLNYNNLYKINKDQAIIEAKELDEFIWGKTKINSDKYFSEISKMLPNKLDEYKIVDIGSGAGRFIFYCIDRFRKVISVEPSIEGFKFQKEVFKNSDNFEVHNKYAEDFLINLKEDEEIIIYSNAVLHHIKNDAVDLILKKLNKLKKGSLIILSESYTINGSFDRYWMGYMRPKEYYIKRLSNYELTFFDYYDEAVIKDINHNIRGTFIGKKIV
jgi:SAM-dependent methyltransferase